MTIPNAINVHKTAGLIPCSGAGAGWVTVTWFETLNVNVVLGSRVATCGITDVGVVSVGIVASVRGWGFVGCLSLFGGGDGDWMVVAA